MSDLIPISHTSSIERNVEVLPSKKTPPTGSKEDLSKSDNHHENANEYVTGIKLTSIVASVALACFLMLLDTMVVSTAIPRITDTFNSLLDVRWDASAYQFGSAAPQPLTGKVYTHFNTKWSLLSFFAIFEIGSILYGAAVSSDMLIVGRAVAGFGAAGITNGAITIISSCAPLEKRPALIGLTMGLMQFGLVAGPLVGGGVSAFQAHSFVSFYVNLPVGAFTALVILLVRIPEQIPKPKALVTVVWASALYQAFMISAVYGATFFLPIYFQAINNVTAMLSGVYLLPTIVPQLLMAGLSGVMLQKIGFIIPIAVVGLSMQLAIISIQAAVGEEELATGMVLVIFAQSLGPAIVLVVCNVIFNSSLKFQLQDNAPHTDAAAVISAGATGFRAIVQGDDLPGVLIAYVVSIDRVFYLVAGVAAACIIVLWGMGWQDLRTKGNKVENGAVHSDKHGESA
ncbi:MFS general substrate transporter [Hypoxylon trugodes]|uniref:MFS general substrate transporter n=1 Tax=Hypoxylon trugodes TaxID=326681 RepID=UPI00219EF2A4|nr:MFS general substrate transporter [Hypoxylon trugodes]KAI1384507.1 MFS general substrate transporter [Hypoxylon trugodes]